MAGSDPVTCLVVDDEEGIRFFVEEALRRVGYICTSVGSGEEALELLEDTSFDLVYLDLMLGGQVDGLRVLEVLRWRWPRTAVVVLTAHPSVESAVKAIQQDAEGYLLKPVEPAELRRTAQEAVERRARLFAGHEAEHPETIERGPFRINIADRRATLNNVPLDLTPLEFELLAHLARNSDGPVPLSELERVVREAAPERLFNPRELVKWYIVRLRKSVEEDPERPRYIVEVPGIGYRFGLE